MHSFYQALAHLYGKSYEQLCDGTIYGLFYLPLSLSAHAKTLSIPTINTTY
jgi:hypothetical protein